MKKMSLTIFFVFILLASKNPSPKLILDLNEAVEKKLVEYKIDGRGGSPHYAQPAYISLKNLTDQTINIRIPNGQRLVSHPSTVQDLIVVNEELFILPAQSTKAKNLYAMCTQHQNSGPSIQTNYTLGKLATGPLKELAKEIQNRRDHNTLGQYAIWTLTNDRDLSTISGFDDTTALHYQKFVSERTDKPMPVLDTTDYFTNYHKQNLIEYSLGGSFEYGFSRESAVTIGMFDERDIIVRELYNKSNVPPGEHRLDFKFDASAYTDSVYFIRLIVDHKIKINFKMEMSI